MQTFHFKKLILSPTSLLLFGLQVISHGSFIFLIFKGHLWQWLVALLVYFLNGCIGMTITYHRYLAHKSFEMPQWFKVFGVLCASIGLTGSALSWVAIHRQHHQFVDTERDAHSPQHLGWFTVHFLSMFLPISRKYFSDLMRDQFLQQQHKYYFAINLIYAIALWCIDPMAIVYAWLVPAALLWNGGGFIVSTSHRAGRPHSDLILGLLVWGEGFHSEHHESPKAFRFHQYDLGGAIIQHFFKPHQVIEKNHG